MRHGWICSAALATAFAATPAMAEELWLISAGEDFAYFIDAHSIVTMPGDIAKASVHHVYFQLYTMEDGREVRVVSRDVDFDCLAHTYMYVAGVGLDDAINAIIAVEPEEAKPLPPQSNIEGAALFACGDAAAREGVAQRMNGDATLTEAVDIARNVGASRQP